MAMNLDKQRAMYALDKVDSFVNGHPDKDNKSLKSVLKSLPALIRINGIGQAMAWHKSKGAQHTVAYQWLEEWVVQRRNLLENQGGNEFLPKIVRSTLQQYWAAQAEALAMAGWLKKMAAALIEGEDNEQ